MVSINNTPFARFLIAASCVTLKVVWFCAIVFVPLLVGDGKDANVILALLCVLYALIAPGVYLVVRKVSELHFAPPEVVDNANVREPIICCSNGHSFKTSTAKAGGSISCPSCGIATKVPSLSELRGA